MKYTKEQISEIISKHVEQRNGMNDLLSIMLESMMLAERGEFLHGDVCGNKGNGYRPGRTYGQGKRLEFRIPRDRYGNFHPQILAILHDRLGLLWPIMKEIGRNGTDIDKKCGPEDVRTQKNIIFVKILKVADLIPRLQTH